MKLQKIKNRKIKIFKTKIIKITKIQLKLQTPFEFLFCMLTRSMKRRKRKFNFSCNFGNLIHTHSSRYFKLIQHFSPNVCYGFGLQYNHRYNGAGIVLTSAEKCPRNDALFSRSSPTRILCTFCA